jgi:CRP-like cAMP-binding protein
MIRSGWLGQLPEPLAEAVLAAGRWVVFAEREIVYGLGIQDRSLWGIESGCVRFQIAVNEAAPRFAHVAGPGYWFGEHAFLTGRPRLFEVETASACRLLMLEYKEAERIGENQPEIWREIAHLAGLSQATAMGAADDLMLRGTHKRLAAVLLRLASRRNAFQGAPPVDVIPATQSEIADACGMSRTVAASAMAAFVASGAIKTEYGRIRILQPEFLERTLRDDA